MKTLDQLIDDLGGREVRFGVLAESNTYQLTVIAMNTDVAVGDLFLLPCKRGPERFYVFRTTQYANVMNRMIGLNDVARNKLTMEDSYFSKDLQDENLIELKGIVLGYAEREGVNWTFHRPRRLPEHLTDVYRVTAESAPVVKILMSSQLGQDGLYIGNLLAGEKPLDGVEVFLPAYALSHHIGVFGRTGCGKSNTMMVFLSSIMDHNRLVATGKRRKENGKPEQRCSILGIDPHDEFQTWHHRNGGRDGIRGIVNEYTDAERETLVNPFYYITGREPSNPGLERKLKLSWADITPQDLASVVEMTDQMNSFANRFFSQSDASQQTAGDRWIDELLYLSKEAAEKDPRSSDTHPGTIDGVKRRLGFLQAGNNRIFTKYSPLHGDHYESILPDVIVAMESGRVVIVDTTLVSEIEQFMFSTIVARVLFALRKAIRCSESSSRLKTEIRTALGIDDDNGITGMEALATELWKRVESHELPYLVGDGVVSTDVLPYINVVIEEAPSVLNPERIRFGSVFRDISRQGRKFGIGLTVISQQVTAIDQGILTQINTELTMALGNEEERRAAVRNASADLTGFERELQVMGKGQAIATASYRDIPLPTQAPNFDTIELWLEKQKE
jgi:DNA helicase HerA-like ATPase